METQVERNERAENRHASARQGGASGAVYGMGVIGAWVYFLGHATTFWIGVLGIVKGIFWPAFLVYEMLKFLNM